MADRHIELTLDSAARQWLADKGYDPVYGARPLKRVIQRTLQNPLASLILDGTISDGEKVFVSVGKDDITINGTQVKAA
jgi:ATP-dependent Clp protease ATP-binding subunit ClpB